MKLFDLLKNKRYEGEVVDLIKVYEIKEEPSVFYNIVIHGTNKLVGRCDLRVGMNWELYYAGNIGYFVNVRNRGNAYAYHACKILFSIAKNEYNMNEIIITCSPDNIASYKTCLNLNGTLLETAIVPESHWLAQRGENIKYIFGYKL